MNLIGGSIVFLLSWWLCLFIVLPIGVRGQHEHGDMAEGTEEGAPVSHMMPKKLLWATIGAVICTVIAGVIVIPLLQYYGG